MKKTHTIRKTPPKRPTNAAIARSKRWAETTPLPEGRFPKAIFGDATYGELITNAVGIGGGVTMALVDSKMKKTRVDLTFFGRDFRATITPITQ